MNQCVGVGTLSGQCGELVDGKIGGGLGLLARHACLRQLAFGLAQLELRVEPGGHTASRDVDDVLALRLGAFGNVRERVFAVQLDVGLGDGAGEHEPRVVHIEAGGLSESLRAMHGVGLASPEIEIPVQGRAGLTFPEAVSRERRGNDVILGGALVQGARIEVGAGEQPCLRRLGLRDGFAHSGLGFGQGRAVFEPQPNQPIELWVLKGIPPAVGGRLGGDAGQTDAVICQARRVRSFLRRENASRQGDEAHQ